MILQIHDNPALSQAPGVVQLIAANESNRHLAAYTQEVMRGDNWPLPVCLREAVAAISSGYRGCMF